MRQHRAFGSPGGRSDFREGSRGSDNVLGPCHHRFVQGEPSITEAFDPADVISRFVLSMSMARNDIERCLHDLLRVTQAEDTDGPDFSYRIRLLTAHFYEAALALRQYRQHRPEVAAFVKALPAKAQADLKTIAGTEQRIGPDALERMRAHTFHYPHPDPKHPRESDEQLEETMRLLADEPANVYVDFATRRVHLTYADRVALALSLGGHSGQRDRLEAQLALARDGAFAFRRFVDYVLLAVGVEFGAPAG